MDATKGSPVGKPLDTSQSCLIVECDSTWQGILRRILGDENLRIEVAHEVELAKNKLKSQKFALMTLDLSLDREKQFQWGRHLLAAAKAEKIPLPPTIIVTGSTDYKDVIDIINIYRDIVVYCAFKDELQKRGTWVWKGFTDVVSDVLSQAQGISALSPSGEAFMLRGNNVFFAYALKKHDLVLKLTRHVEREHQVTTVLMNEESHEGRPLLEKFEDLARECGFGVFVLTKDDQCLTSTPTGEKQESRARQNVILELGFFWGMLGLKKRMAILVEEDVEVPIDLQGLGRIPITPDLAETKLLLSRELKSAGI